MIRRAQRRIFLSSLYVGHEDIELVFTMDSAIRYMSDSRSRFRHSTRSWQIVLRFDFTSSLTISGQQDPQETL